MEQQVVERILQRFGVQATGILPAQKGYRNRAYGVQMAGGMLNLIIYKSEPGILARIKNANAIGAFLETRGGVVRALRDNRLLRATTPAGAQTYAALYNYLPGNTIPWEAYTMEHIKALGAAMSDMHAMLADFNADDLPDVADENLALLSRMQRYFADSGVQKAMAKKLGLTITLPASAKLLQLSKKFPSHQALHMDFVRGNILFDGARITGILDFEKAACGHPLFDIARTLAFLLVDCKYKPESKVRKYFLQSGYAKRGRAALPNIAIYDQNMLEQLATFYLVHDFYKFLRHNPYESLAANEHFTRTKMMLLKRGIITHNRVE
jgi:Ser/Thr protein kinase RdoA (MazF antagonist)